VVGIPADISALGGMQATYTLLGATQPTSENTGAVAGTLNSMNMTADFLGSSNANISGSMSWTLQNKPLSATFSGGTDGTAFYAGGPTSFCGSVNLTGVFAGANAARAGLVYEVYDSSIDSEDYFVGAAALRQTSLMPTQTIEAHVGTVGSSNFDIFTFTTATFDSGGLLMHFDDFSGPVTVQGPVANSGNDGIIAWGRALGATGGECCLYNSSEVLHYVTGVPTDISALGGMQATYTLLGATQPTSVNTGIGTGNSLNSMSMTANFFGGSDANVSGSMNLTLQSNTVSASFSGGTDGTTTFFAGGSTSFSGSVDLQGFFAGANASRAGVVYSVSNLTFASGDSFVGTAALKQTGLTQLPQ
jgi:hypothetical protein